MPVRFLNTHTGRVVQYSTPEEIAPKSRAYSSRDEKARAERDASHRERLLNTLRKSSRWETTDLPVERKTDRQRDSEAREALKREVEGQVRAEHERALEVERAKAAHTPAAPAPTPEAEDAPDGPAEPTAAQVRAWAKDQGLEVTPRGKVPDEVVAAYKQAQAEADGE